MSLIRPSVIQTHKGISDIRETNNHPVIGECDDYQDYVIKHTRGNLPCTKLVNELLASFFLKLWGIPTPEVSFVSVRTEDIQEIRETHSAFCQPRFFHVPCFGTHFYQYGLEFNDFLGQVKGYERPKFDNLEVGLKIGLFDIWMANEDRTSNNPNLIIVPKDEGYEITAIDHESCFNTNSLLNGIYQIGYNDSILSHPAMVQLCGPIMRKEAEISGIVEEAYLYIRKCEQMFAEILSFVPPEWEVDIEVYKEGLGQLFSKEWLAQTEETFRSIIQEINNQKR